jgi:hypothetical protein
MGQLKPLPIPVVDVRDGGPLRHAVESPDRARALRDACLGWFPAPARLMLPVLDGVARRWLLRSQSPYSGEVGSIASALGFSGIWFLNCSYQWSCTTHARDEAGAPWIARTLDWPFPGLGRSVEIARMQGAAGEFANVTWPGYAGTLTGLAPGRFAAALNQAPLRRRTHVPALRLYDLAANAVTTLRRVRFIPPDQLLRFVFEEADDYVTARRMLEMTPVARPAIFTLAGCRKGERCVIERTETDFMTHTDNCSAANDWLKGRPHWEGRVNADRVLSSTYEEAAQNSRNRRESLAAWSGSIAKGGFGWVAPPVLNRYTRLAVEMCAAKGMLRVVGYEMTPGSNLPSPATLPCELKLERQPV